MAYIVNQDVIDRVGTAVAAQVSSETGAAVDAAVVTQVVNAAEGEVNGALARRFATPIDVSVDADLAATLKAITIKLAVFHLMSRRPPVSEVYKQEHDEAMAWLRDVAAGIVALPGAITPASATSDKPVSTSGSSTPVAGRDVMI